VTPYPAVNNFKSFNCNDKSQQQNLTQVARFFDFVSAEGTDTAIILQILR